MSPEQLAKSGTESAHQIALFAWAALSVGTMPELKWLFHVPNGGSRGDTGKSRAIAGGRLKAEGVRKGVPDICLLAARKGYHGICIEMKRPSEKPKTDRSKGGLSSEQIDWLNNLSSEGYACYVCYSWTEAAEALKEYLKK